MHACHLWLAVVNHFAWLLVVVANIVSVHVISVLCEKLWICSLYSIDKITFIMLLPCVGPGNCTIGPKHFVAEVHKTHLNQVLVSLVLFA